MRGEDSGEGGTAKHARSCLEAEHGLFRPRITLFEFWFCHILTGPWANYLPSLSLSFSSVKWAQERSPASISLRINGGNPHKVLNTVGKE